MGNTNTNKLFDACKDGNLETVKLVLSKADLERDNYYAIRCASGNGHLEIVKYLVSEGITMMS